jgi:hypothetical protein
MGNLLDGSDNKTKLDGSIVINGTEYISTSTTQFDILVLPGNYVAIGSSAGFDPVTVAVNANINAALGPLRMNISLPISQCKQDCSLGGRCDYNQCGGICGVTVNDPIYAACQGKLVGSIQSLNSTHYINCCNTPVLSTSLRINFSMSTCSSQVIPMKRIVSYNGRMYTLVTASFNQCE